MSSTCWSVTIYIIPYISESLVHAGGVVVHKIPFFPGCDTLKTPIKSTWFELHFFLPLMQRDIHIETKFCSGVYMVEVDCMAAM